MSKIRVRFAPSPTGHVHVGNARTALFNWLFARHHGGVFVLRIEDTDIERSREEYERQLISDLRWLGLDWDEGPDVGGPFGPYRQSERKEFYERYAAQLIEGGLAYYCFCSERQLEAERKAALAAGRQPKYSGRCRALSLAAAAQRRAAGEPAAVRLKIAGSPLSWNDLVHGPTSFSSEVVGDFILMRSDGHPAYNYAVVIDDHLMEISHVIRGDDHISNTPRQLALYQALGWEPPQFAHLSTILGPDRTRLSKRHGATSLENFRETGILPEALVNYLALLGWSPGDGKTELLSPPQLIAEFSLDHITKSAAVFDTEKLFWMNRHYLKETPLRRLVALSVPFFVTAGYLEEPVQPSVLAWLEGVLAAVLKTVDHLSQLPSACRVVFEFSGESALHSEETKHVAEDEGCRAVLSVFIPRVLAVGELTYERFREIAQVAQKQTGKKGKEFFHPVRVALTGAVSGPELEKLIPILEEGSKLPLPRRVKSVAERLREFAVAARLDL